MAGPPDMSPGVDPLRGYRMTMAEAPLSDSGLIMFGDFDRVSTEHAVYRLLDRRPGLDAIFVASDLMAAARRCAAAAAGCLKTWPSSASTTRRWPGTPTRN